MNEQERRANQGLHALDEAHRSGRITREDYRARRRALLENLYDSDGVTARNALDAVRGRAAARIRREHSAWPVRWATWPVRCSRIADGWRGSSGWRLS